MPAKQNEKKKTLNKKKKKMITEFDSIILLTIQKFLLQIIDHMGAVMVSVLA